MERNTGPSKFTASRIFGFLSLVGAAFLWALGGVVAKILLKDSVSSLDLVQLRLTISCLFTFALLKKLRGNGFQIFYKDIPALIAAGIIGLFFNEYTYYKALQTIHVSMAVSLEYLAPIFVTTYSGFVLRKRFSKAALCGLVGALIGSFLVVRGYRIKWIGLNSMGVTFGILAALSMAILTLLMDDLSKKYHMFTNLFYGMLAAVLFLGILRSPFHALYQMSSCTVCLGVLFISAFATFIPLLLYTNAVKLLGALPASVGMGLEMLIAAMLSSLFLEETFELAQIVGGVLLIFMVTLVQLEFSNIRNFEIPWRTHLPQLKT